MSETADDNPEGVLPTGRIEGERHVSEVAGRTARLSKRTGITLIVAATALCSGLILWTAQPRELHRPQAPQLELRPAIRYEPPPPPLPAPQPVVPPTVLQAPPPLPAAEKHWYQPQSMGERPSRQERLLVYTSGHQGPGDAASNTGVPLTGEDAGADGLTARLRPTQLTGVRANILRNQPFLLTVGTLIPCTLQTAMDSTLPGFVTCVIPQDVLGKTGLTLLDRGTKVVGQFQGGIRQGLERMFVVWTRAETPQGVVINLDSPAADPLGRSGMDGEVERHFWQRFGGALLLSMVDGAIQAGVATASQDGTTTINTGQAQSVVAESLRGTINIPPTIRKNQGELVSIFVARDLDFSSVYQVEATPPRSVSESYEGSE